MTLHYAAQSIPMGPDDELVELEVPVGETCPSCDGRGVVTVIEPVFQDGGWFPVYVGLDCQDCGGQGWVPFDAGAGDDDGPQWAAESRYTLPSRLLAS